MRILLLLFVMAVSGWSTTHEIYFNSKFTGTSTGAIDAPYKKPSEANSVVSTWRAAEDTTIMYWRDSSVFRESWTIPSGAGLLIIKNYGELGKKPILTGGVLVTGWTAYASGLGSTWQYTIAQTVGNLWKNDTILTKSTNQNTLTNNTWYQTGGVLYYRLDTDNPDSCFVERTTLTQTLNLNGQSNIFFNGVEFEKSSTFGIRVTTSASNMRFDNCTFDEYSGHLSLTSVSNAVFSGCIFTRGLGPGTPITISGESSIQFINCHFKNSYYGLVSISGGKNKFINCNFDNFRNNAIYSTSYDSVFVTNSLIHGIYPYTTTTLNATLGPVIIDNSTLINNGYVSTPTYTGNVILKNMYRYDPKIVKTSRTGFLSIAEDDRINGADFKKLADYAKSINPNISMTLSVSEVHQLNSVDSAIIKALADSGHDIASHTMSHTYIYPNMGLFKVRYTGSAEACTLVVDTANWACYTKTTGGIDDVSIDIDFDLTKTMSWFLDQWDGLPYTVTKIEGINARQMIFVAQGGELVDIKTKTDSILLDMPRFNAWELDSSKLYLERITGKPCVSYVYPGGLTDSTQIPAIKSAGYLGARLASPVPLTMRDTFPLFKLPIQWEAHLHHCIMRLDVNTNSLMGNHFTSVGVTHDATLHAEYIGCAVLDGSAYFYRNDTTFHYSNGDYTIGIWVRPTTLNAINTVFYTGINADSCLTVYIDSDGAVHYVQRRGGTDVVHITSADNTIQVNQWSRLSFRQAIDTISIYKSVDVPAQNRVAMTATTTQPDLYNGVTYFGCNYSTGSATGMFTGYMDKIDIGFENWWRGISCADQIAMQGTWSSSLTHGEGGAPRDLHKTALDAAASYTGRIKIIGIASALQILRANGSFINEDSLCIVWDQPDSADYRLRSDSKLVGAADVSVLSGIPNLINLSGDQITDADGNLLVESVNIGAYGTFNVDPPQPTKPQSFIHDIKGTLRGFLRGFWRW